MNGEKEKFEQHLSHQRMRPIPAAWREEILAAAGRASQLESRTPEQSGPSTLVARLSAFFWPHPAAWAGLAAIWILILAVDFSVRDQTPALVERPAPPSPEVIVQLQQQQRLLAELLGPREAGDADRSKSLAPRPRSECVEFLAA